MKRKLRTTLFIHGFHILKSVIFFICHGSSYLILTELFSYPFVAFLNINESLNCSSYTMRHHIITSRTYVLYDKNLAPLSSHNLIFTPLSMCICLISLLRLSCSFSTLDPISSHSSITLYLE